MFDFITAAALADLGAVILIDLVLAGDNAVVVGMAAAGLPREQRAKVILFGIIAATVLRIAFAGGTVYLLQYGKYGLVVAGGLLLAWVSWKLWHELEAERARRKSAAEAADEAAHAPAAPTKTFGQAVFQIIIADVSMSLDNVLAVAGVARDHPWVLVVGLVLSVAFMGLAATFIAKLLHKYHWIGYVGLIIIVYVAGDMMWQGYNEAAGTYGLQPLK